MDECEYCAEEICLCDEDCEPCYSCMPCRDAYCHCTAYLEEEE